MNGMTVIVKTITRLILGFILIFAVSTVLYGHITPGGGFAGGVMLACGFVLLVLAFGKAVALNIVNEKGLEVWDSVGSLMFWGIAVAGFSVGMYFTGFLDRGDPLRLISGGTILWSNIGIGIKVSAGILAAFIALAQFRMSGKR